MYNYTLQKKYSTGVCVVYPILLCRVLGKPPEGEMAAATTDKPMDLCCWASGDGGCTQAHGNQIKCLVKHQPFFLPAVPNRVFTRKTPPPHRTLGGVSWRHFLNWLGLVAVSSSPLTRVNTTPCRRQPVATPRSRDLIFANGCCVCVC